MQTVDDVPELGHKHSSLPFVEVRWDLQQHNSSIIYFKNVSWRVQVLVVSDFACYCSQHNLPIMRDTTACVVYLSCTTQPCKYMNLGKPIMCKDRCNGLMPTY